MLRFSDSRNFGRTLAAIGLVLGPVLFFIGSLIDPAWSDDAAEYIGEVDADSGLYALSGVLWTLGSLLFVAGTLGLVRLLRGRKVGLGQIAATLLTLGLIGLSAGMAFNGFDIALADFDDRDAAVAYWDSLEDSALLNAYWIGFFMVGIVLGSILLAIALFRRRIVPIWAPILIIVSVVMGFAGGEEKLLSALSFLVLAAGMLPLAMRMWSLSDEQWARWEPLGEEPATEAREASGPAPAGVS